MRGDKGTRGFPTRGVLLLLGGAVSLAYGLADILKWPGVYIALGIVYLTLFAVLELRR